VFDSPEVRKLIIGEFYKPMQLRFDKVDSCLFRTDVISVISNRENEIIACCNKVKVYSVGCSWFRMKG